MASVSVVAVAPRARGQVVRVVADVVEVDEGGGFCASVLYGYGAATVVLLDRSLRGAAHEGRVRRWAMDGVAGRLGSGYFEYRLADDAMPSMG